MLNNIDGLRTIQFKPAAHRSMCTDCGLSRMSRANDCATACQFIKPDYASHEVTVHGRQRDQTSGSDELFFGPVKAMYRAQLKEPKAGAQWSGITTRIAERLLESDAVDAVMTMAPDPHDSWKPVPVLVTKSSAMQYCRGMRMGYAPILALLEPALEQGYKRIALIGIPCQVHALRVIGTPCSDNTTTENFHGFLGLIGERIGRSPEEITYLEFCADYHVELRFKDGQHKRIPFLQLPLSQLSPDFFPMTCRTCVDYTNALADITVGYMGGEGQQWLLVRNTRGQELLDLIAQEVSLTQPGSGGKRDGAVKGFKKNVELAAGGLPLRQMPNWLRPIVGWLMPIVGPRGLEFARARVEMKAIETITHLRREHPKRLRSMVPEHVWKIASRYGLTK
jgi:coenzyme F420 hydrogenase subunit beta